MTKTEEVVLARMVNMRLNIDGFEEATLKKLEKNYKAAIKALLVDVQKAKGKPGRIWTNTRLIKVLEEAQLQHRAIVEALGNSVAGSVADVGVYSYKEMNNIVGWDGLVEGFNDVTIPRARLLQMTKVTKIGGKDLAEWVGAALEPDLEAIKAQIATGVIRGQGYDKMVRAIKDELDLVKGSKKARDMETVVKSYIQSMNVAAQEDIYNANEEILDQVEWSAIMENGNFATGRGTCPRCMALDGQRWGLKESRPDCPLHARCRCLLYPVTKSWDDLLPGRGLQDLKESRYKTPWNIRNLDTKQRQIIARGRQYGDYEVFWKSQSLLFQNNAIGPKRAAMVRNGMPFKSIIDKDGKLIPIRDLPDKFKPKPLKKKPVKKVVSFVPATTVSKAEKWSLKNVANKVDFSKVNLSVANEINKTLNSLIVKSKIGKLDELSGLPDSDLNIKGDLGFAPGNRIFFNRDRISSVDNVGLNQTSKAFQIKELQERIVKRESKGWTIETDKFIQRYSATIDELETSTIPEFTFFVGDKYTVGDLITHEFGHVVDTRAYKSFLDIGDINDIDIVIKKTKQYTDRKEKVFGSFLRANKENGLTLSEYAATNSDEYIAEAYSAYKQGNIKILNDDVIKFIKEMEKRGG